MMAKPEDVRLAMGEGRHVDALLTAWTLRDPAHTADLCGIDLRELIFRACQQMVESGRKSDVDWEGAVGQIDTLLRQFPPPNLLVADSREPAACSEPAEAYRALMVRAYLLSARAALGGAWSATSGVVGTEGLHAVVDELDRHIRESGSLSGPSITRGFARDLTDLLSGGSVRPAVRSERVGALVVVDGSSGVPAMLHLELIADGRGELYPHEEMAFVHRDESFVRGERDAWTHAQEVVRGTSQTGDGATIDADVRFRLFRRSGTSGEETLFTRLSGDSASGAFGLGLLKLLAG
jgi:hypothetical protein